MLEIRNLTKRYGKFTALENLNLRIREGEIFGFVGPNGAGKTTTMRITSGLLKADSGEVLIHGENVLRVSKGLKDKIGYMPDFFGVYDNLKAIEYMEFFAAAYGLTGSEIKKKCLNLLELVNLSEHAMSYVDEMSRGMKQRLCLARCLVHEPKVLLLDEPAAGLDPRARIEMKNILKELKSDKKTILISSHILPELAQISDTIGIIEKGKIVVSGTVEDILAAKGSASPLLIKVTAGIDAAVKVLKENKETKNITIRNNQISLLYMGNEEREAGLLTALIQNGVMISSFSREESNLESLFMQITAEKE